MKKILIILMLALIASPVWAEWTQIAESNDKGAFVVYADLTSAQRAGGRVKMWVLYDYESEQRASGTNFLSKKIRRDYNCREAGIRTLAFSLFSWNMEKGELLRSYNQPQQWKRVQPDSMKEVEWTVACAEP
ncbi:surface-adhesin E family protein [Nitrosomonas marina]|nr:surface-adhesin E family protein [Nitrosomonas marina]